MYKVQIEDIVGDKLLNILNEKDGKLSTILNEKDGKQDVKRVINEDAFKKMTEDDNIPFPDFHKYLEDPNTGSDVNTGTIQIKAELVSDGITDISSIKPPVLKRQVNCTTFQDHSDTL